MHSLNKTLVLVCATIKKEASGLPLEKAKKKARAQLIYSRKSKGYEL